MPFSEVVFQCYKAECEEIEELKKFQFFRVSNIGNTEYGIMIDDIYKRRGEKRFGEAANKWIKWTAFLGTPKVGILVLEKMILQAYSTPTDISHIPILTYHTLSCLLPSLMNSQCLSLV